jgi:hypothetical protein
MLSSIPGVAMKATSTGMVIGVALEDFDETRAYSDTFINQFGDDIATPRFTPVTSANDPRINDGCYYGGGSAAGEGTCVPLSATTTDAQVAEAAAIEAAAARSAALRALAAEGSQTRVTEDGETVRVGQIVMFVDLRTRTIDETTETMLAALVATPEAALETIVGREETVWGRLVVLASQFVDGVLTLTGVKADKVETEELCVGGVCVDAARLQQLLDNASIPNEPVSTPSPVTAPTPTPQPEPETDTVTEPEPTPATPVEPTTPTPEEPVIEPTPTDIPAGDIPTDTPVSEPVVEETPVAATEPVEPTAVE